MARALTPGELWREAPTAAARFDPTRLAGLPEGARRCLGHALAPGAPLARAVRLEMRGTIRLGDWHPFEAEQVIVQGRGMVWAARVRMKGLTIPTRLRVGWWPGTARFAREGEFFRAEVTGVGFR